MKHLLLLFFFAISFIKTFSQKTNSKDYFPSAQIWEKRSPAESGFDTAKLSDAIQFAIANETKQPRDMELSQQIDRRQEPFNYGIGPFKERGAPTGVIIYHGYIVAEWGEPSRVDMTHSVTKSFLSTVVGIAVDHQFIHSTNDTVAKYIPPIELYDPLASKTGISDNGKDELLYPFAGEHNSKLTWEVMLRQTSDWEGTLWGKPDWADRPDSDPNKWLNRKRNEPGTVWEYNDVRVNALALAATCVWRKPLPQVLKEYIMDPIVASNTWRWYGSALLSSFKQETLLINMVEAISFSIIFLNSSAFTSIK